MIITLVNRLSYFYSNDHPNYHKPGIMMTYSYPDPNRTKTHATYKYFNNNVIVKI